MWTRVRVSPTSVHMSATRSTSGGYVQLRPAGPQPLGDCARQSRPRRLPSDSSRGRHQPRQVRLRVRRVQRALPTAAAASRFVELAEPQMRDRPGRLECAGSARLAPGWRCSRPATWPPNGPLDCRRCANSVRSSDDTCNCETRISPLDIARMLHEAESSMVATRVRPCQRHIRRVH